MLGRRADRDDSHVLDDRRGDVDLVAETRSELPFTLIDLASLQQFLEKSLHQAVDVVTLKTLSAASFAREALEEAVRVF